METGNIVHLPEATALVVRLGGIGAEAARLLAAFGVNGWQPTHAARSLPVGWRPAGWPSCIRPKHWTICCHARIS